MIELKEKNTYNQCFIESHEDEIIHIIYDDDEKINELLTLISGNKKVDTIDLKKLNSTLTVKDYVVFYAMITGIYNDRTIEELTSLLTQNHMGHLLHTPVNALSNIEKIKVRCIAAYLKQISCIVGKDLLSELDPMQKVAFYGFLEEYFIKNNCLCLLIDSIQEEEL